MANRIEQRIGSLEERLKVLRAKQQRVEARKRGIVLAKVEQGVLDRTTLMSWLDAALTREDDRELFSLSHSAGSVSQA